MFSKTSLTLGDWISNAYEGGGKDRFIWFNIFWGLTILKFKE